MGAAASMTPPRAALFKGGAEPGGAEGAAAIVVPESAPLPFPPPAAREPSMSQRQNQRRGGPRADMVPEIAAAVGFVSSLLRTRGCVSEQQLQVFSGALREALAGEARPRRPGKRSAYSGRKVRGEESPLVFVLFFSPSGLGAHWCPSLVPLCCCKGLVSLPGCPPVSSWVGYPSVSPLMPDTYLCLCLGAHPCPSRDWQHLCASLGTHPCPCGVLGSGCLSSEDEHIPC